MHYAASKGALQSLAPSVIGHLLPALPAAAATLPLALFGTRGAGRVLGRMLPRDETTAVSTFRCG